MASTNTDSFGREVSVGEQTEIDEKRREQITGGEKQTEIGRAESQISELRASVEQDIQAKVDTNHPDVRGLTLAAEERLVAREWEIERTHRRFDRRPDSDREARTRTAVARQSSERRYDFEKRAASVDTWADPELDPREQLTREELAAVNQETADLAETLRGWSRAAISRRLAGRVVAGVDMTSAVIEVFEELKRAPGQILPIGAVEDVRRAEVSIRGTVVQLWTPSSPKIAQVGLIEDDSGRIKFTAWKRSAVTRVREGEQVIMRDVARNWYDGRCSVALTGWSRIEFSGTRGRTE